ncbi:MAG: hypothetical protein ACRDQ7_06125 [Haloechinothrix sp.]
MTATSMRRLKPRKKNRGNIEQLPSSYPVRRGKTGELACRILDAPGAVIATSTRTDLLELTSSCRSRRGPVRVFNPSGVGGLASTITFNPLSWMRAPVCRNHAGRGSAGGSVGTRS